MVSAVSIFRPMLANLSAVSQSMRRCQDGNSLQRIAEPWKILPKEALTYLEFLAELMEVPIAIVSLGADRDQTIIVEDPIHGPKRALLHRHEEGVATANS